MESSHPAEPAMADATRKRKVAPVSGSHSAPVAAVAKSRRIEQHGVPEPAPERAPATQAQGRVHPAAASVVAPKVLVSQPLPARGPRAAAAAAAAATAAAMVLDGAAAGGRHDDRGMAEGLVPEDIKGDILRNMLAREAAHAVGGNPRGGITPRMWSILVDWLFEVQSTYSLSQSSLFLGVNILSRFVRLEVVERNELQLAGATALLLASKFEEFDTPTTAEMVYVCADTYAQPEFFAMETRITDALDYRVGSQPSPSSRGHLLRSGPFFCVRSPDH